ncbi:MAG: hypothetical protein ACYTJ0_16675, partial [Planctomycetota bacterium]
TRRSNGTLAIGASVLGAVSTVAVAWAFASWGPLEADSRLPPGLDMAIEGHPPGGDAWQMKGTISTFGSTRRFEWMRMTASEYGSYYRRPTTKQLQVAVDMGLSPCEQRSGWPWRAMWCRTVFDQLIGGVGSPPVAAEAGVVTDGIPLSSGGPRGTLWRALPLRILWTGFLADSALFAVAWVFVAVLAVRLPAGVRDVIRHRRGRCRRCGHDLGPHRAATCPECGERSVLPIAGPTAARPAVARWRRPLRLAKLTGIALAAGCSVNVAVAVAGAATTDLDSRVTGRAFSFRGTARERALTFVTEREYGRMSWSGSPQTERQVLSGLPIRSFTGSEHYERGERRSKLNRIWLEDMGALAAHRFVPLRPLWVGTAFNTLVYAAGLTVIAGIASAGWRRARRRASAPQGAANGNSAPNSGATPPADETVSGAAGASPYTRGSPAPGAAPTHDGAPPDGDGGGG